MAAYPFVKAITLTEMKEKLVKGYQCNVGSKELNVQGKKEKVEFVERQIGKRNLKFVLPEEDGYCLAPSIVRSICHKLEIDPKDFGFSLG